MKIFCSILSLNLKLGVNFYCDVKKSPNFGEDWLVWMHCIYIIIIAKCK